MGWQDPPWCGLSSLSNLAALDFSEEIRPGRELRYAKGDIPSYFYALGLLEEMAAYFGLPNLGSDEFRATIAEAGLPPLSGKGSGVGLRVAAMGFSWSVFLAQVTAEDIFDGGFKDDLFGCGVPLTFSVPVTLEGGVAV